MNNYYYIYIYLDPRKLGQYCYNNVYFLFEPIYIGKGSGRRFKRNNDRNKYFMRKINKIKKSGLESIVIKLYENLSEDQSFSLEKQLIQEVGRINLKTGTLLNMTDGGEGISGYKHNKETKRRISELNSGENNWMFGKHHTSKIKNIMSLNKKGKYVGENNHFYGKHHSDESIEKIKQSKIGQSSGEKNTKSKLKEYEVIEIKNSSLPIKELSKKYNISIAQLYSIRRGDSWSYLN